MPSVVFLTNQSIDLEKVTGTTWLAVDTSLLIPQLSTGTEGLVIIPKGEPRFLQVQMLDHYPRTLFFKEDIDEFMASWTYFKAPRMQSIS
jgi:hypothetical protein